MTHSVFQGRSFLAEKDFSRAELEYLIGLSAHLKDLKKHLLVLGQLLQQQLLTWEHIQNTLVLTISSLARKNLQKILLKFWAVCLTGLNSAVSANAW